MRRLHVEFPIRRGFPTRDGFALLELVAVLFVLGVLGLVVGSGVVRRVKAANRDAERISLRTLAASLSEEVVRTKSVPGPTEWVPGVAELLAVPVQRVSTNGAGAARWLVYDPDFRLGAEPAPPPYAQTGQGSVRPTHARAILVSNLGRPFEPKIVDARAFEDLWGSSPDASARDGGVLAAGQSGEVEVARVDLSGLFHCVELENRDPAGSAHYVVGGSGESLAIPPGERREFWLIATSTVALQGGDGAVQKQDLVAGDLRCVFEAGEWRRVGAPDAVAGGWGAILQGGGMTTTYANHVVAER